MPVSEQERTCRRKRTYRTKEAAEEAAKRAWKRRRIRLFPYPCPIRPNGDVHYHLTSRLY